jgi:hypothetical protein
MMGGICSKHGTGEILETFLIGEPAGQRLLARPRRRLENNAKIGLM